MERYLLLGETDVLLDTKCISSFSKKKIDNKIVIEFKYFGGEKVNVFFTQRGFFDEILVYLIMRKIVRLMNKRKI